MGAGMVVHPSPGHSGGTLVNAILHRYSLPAVSLEANIIEDGSQVADDDPGDDDVCTETPSQTSFQSQTLPQNGNQAVIRPGIVHRLDKGTTGLMVVCRTDIAMLRLGEQFRARTVRLPSAL